jgi:hypothetical protein
MDDGTEVKDGDCDGDGVPVLTLALRPLPTLLLCCDRNCGEDGKDGDTEPPFPLLAANHSCASSCGLTHKSIRAHQQKTQDTMKWYERTVGFDLCHALLHSEYHKPDNDRFDRARVDIKPFYTPFTHDQSMRRGSVHDFILHASIHHTSGW